MKPRETIRGPIARVRVVLEYDVDAGDLTDSELLGRSREHWEKMLAPAKYGRVLKTERVNDDTPRTEAFVKGAKEA